MTTGATGQLGLALPVQGELSGTWGDTVNNGITQYTNIAIAATLTLTNDGAVTLANTTGDASATNITSSLTGAGTVTAQFAIVRVTGTLTTAKVITAPSYSKTYVVVNAATGGIVTFKASGQTGVSIAVGESAWVYYNGTDYVKIAGTTSGSAGGSNTQVQYNSSGSLAGSSNLTFDGTNLTLGGGTANGVTYLNGSKVLTSGSALTFDGSQLLVNSNSTTASGFFQINDSTTTQANSFGTIVRNANDGNGRYSLSAWRAQNASGLTQYAYIGAQSISGASNYTPELVFGLSTGASTYAEQGRWTTTGLGIGTSSPNTKIEAYTSSSGTQALLTLQQADNTPGNSWGIDFRRTGSSANVVRARVFAVREGGDATALALSYTTSGGTLTQGLYLNSDGNLGLGVTPSAWSIGKAIEVNSVGCAVWSAGTKDIRLVSNVYYASGNYKYASTGTASQLQMPDDGSFRFENAASGSTGGTITFSERARIQAGFSVGTTADPGAGAIYATGNITAYYSDDRLKTRLGVIENALDKVDQLQGFYYEANETAQALGYKVKREVGVSAQSVQAVLPEIVSPAPIDQQYLTVDYERLVPLLIEAVKELTAKVKALEAK